VSDENAIAEIFANAGLVGQPHPNLPSDPVLTEMVRLKSLPFRERNEALEPYMESWIQRQADTISVARYLAAAGFTYEEAAQLENLVRSRVRAEWEQKARTESIRAFGAFLAAGILMVVDTLSHAAFPGYGVVLIVLCAIGIGSLLRSLRLRRRITAAQES
jgi:hypothetical protein